MAIVKIEFSLDLCKLLASTVDAYRQGVSPPSKTFDVSKHIWLVPRFNERGG